MAKAQKAADLRGKSDSELNELLKTTASSIFESRFQNFTNKLNDTAKIGKLRRELARINTVLSERKKTAAKAETPKAGG